MFADATVKATLDEAYDLLLDNVISRLRNTIPEAQLKTLRDAILGFGSTHTMHARKPLNSAEYGQNVKAALVAIQNDKFLKTLNLARQRFDRTSKIDIRGCQVGRDPTFLQAMQSFFGTNATQRPAVSGPQWFQHFFQPAFLSAQTNANISTLFNSGRPPYSATQIRQFFDAWATGFGITDAHITFWKTTLGLNALTFSALQWRSSLPATKVPVMRLVAFSTAAFRDVIARVANIFLTNADVPGNAALSAIDPLLSDLSTWTTQLDATVPDTSTAAQLTDHFNNLKNIYEKVDSRFTGTSSPTSAQRIIPAAPPATMTAQTIRDFQTALKTFIDTHAKSRFLPVKTFLNKSLARTQDAPAKMRYFLCLGLPFLAHNPTTSNVQDNFIVVFEDTGGTNKRQDDAVRFWIRAQWRGIIPAGLAASTTFQNSRHAPWLVEKHQTTPAVSTPPFVISPTDEFQQKIVTINP